MYAQSVLHVVPRYQRYTYTIYTSMLHVFVHSCSLSRILCLTIWLQQKRFLRIGMRNVFVQRFTIKLKRACFHKTVAFLPLLHTQYSTTIGVDFDIFRLFQVLRVIVARSKRNDFEYFIFVYWRYLVGAFAANTENTLFDDRFGFSF